MKEVSRLAIDRIIVYRETADRTKNAYAYWKELLMTISDASDQTKPICPIQWWRDRRDWDNGGIIGWLSWVSS
jgi:hypothetical protein